MSEDSWSGETNRREKGFRASVLELFQMVSALEAARADLDAFSDTAQQLPVELDVFGDGDFLCLPTGDTNSQVALRIGIAKPNLPKADVSRAVCCRKVN